MATPLVLVDANVILNGSNISQYVKSVDFGVKADELDSTTMAGGGWRSRVGGLKDSSIKLELNDDFTAAALDSILWPLFGTVVTMTVKGVSTANSSANAQYQGNVLVSQLSPVSGAVGAIASQSITWPGSGTITRAIT